MTDVDDIRRRLHDAGWSAGETGGATVWLVVASKVGVTVHASGPSQVEAWRSALELAGEGFVRLANSC